MAKEIYSIELRICATAYIVADNEAEAQRLADELADTGMELSSRYQPAGEGICIAGGSYASLVDNAEPVALSPAMTVHGSWTDGDKVELVEVIGEAELPDVPDDFPVQPLDEGEARQRMADGDRRVAQCLGCFRYWDDSVPTSYTPAPAGRCPFEAFHAEAE